MVLQYLEEGRRKMSKILLKINDVKELSYEADGYILGIDKYSFLFGKTFNIDEIKKIKEDLKKKEIFVSFNRVIFNDELEDYKMKLKEIDDAENLKKQVESYISKSKDKLTGPTWEAVRGQMEGYSSLLDTRIANARELYDAIVKANNVMSGWLPPDEEVDDALLPELLSAKASLEAQIAEAKNHKPPYDTSGLEAQLAEVNRKIKKIQEMPGIDNSAYGNLSGAQATGEA